VLTAAYQGLGPSPGTVFIFNVDEIIYTIEHPDQFYIANPREENEKSPNLRPHVASLDDFQYYAIDAINPAIDQIAADLYRTGSGQQINFVVPEGSKTPPIYLGNNTYSVTNVSPVEVESGTQYLIDQSVLTDYGISNSNLRIQTVSTAAFVPTLLPTVPALVPSPGSPITVVKAIPELFSFLKSFVTPGNIVVASKAVLTTIGNIAGAIATVPAPVLLGAAIVGTVLVWKVIDKVREKDTFDVSLTISTFSEGEGLLVGDEGFINRPSQAPESKLYTDSNGVKDYNPSRVLTLTWKVTNKQQQLGKWYLDGKLLSPDELPGNQIAIDRLNLTAGQKYYWHGELTNTRTGEREKIKGGDFAIPQYERKVPISDVANTFSIVTVITPDATTNYGDLNGWEKSLEIAKGIARNFDGKDDDGTILVYNSRTHKWESPFASYSSLTNFVPNKLGAPLILIDEWGLASTNASNGFAEAAADNFFAALVDLNQSYTGAKKNALLNSPLHFIGHGRGAVVNSEVIQRLGTYFPDAGGIVRDASGKIIKGDLQQ
jgi:hypothetical protein